jgi:hypothetical protein
VSHHAKFHSRESGASVRHADGAMECADEAAQWARAAVNCYFAEEKQVRGDVKWVDDEEKHPFVREKRAITEETRVASIGEVHCTNGEVL